jgi:hypothetical protein
MLIRKIIIRLCFENARAYNEPEKINKCMDQAGNKVSNPPAVGNGGWANQPC